MTGQFASTGRQMEAGPLWMAMNGSTVAGRRSS